MAVKKYQQKETSSSISAAEKKLFNQTQNRQCWSAKQTEALLKLWKEISFTRNAKVCHGMAKGKTGSKRARPRKDRHTM